MKLYSGPLSLFTAKVRVALDEKRLAYQRIEVGWSLAKRYEPHHPDVVRLNPKRQVPVLVDGELAVYDSTQIFEYLEDAFPVPSLWPTDVAARAEARQLELKSDEVFFPHVIRLMILEATPADPQAVLARSAAARFYAAMDTGLQMRPYLAGVYSYADIAFFMAQLFAERKGAVMSAATPRLQEWRARMLGRPAVRQVAGTMAAWLASRGRPVPEFLLGTLPDKH
jgi:glutathione S-transferase